MLDWQPITIDTLATVRPFVRQQPYRVSDFSVGVIFMWRDFLQTTYVLQNDTLFLRVVSTSGNIYYTVPLGTDPIGGLHALEQDAKERYAPLQFSGVCSAALPYFEQVFGNRMELTAFRDSADYLYTADTFLTFAGRHLSGKRNHLRRFYAAHPNCQFVPLTAENMPQAIAFIQQYLDNKSGTPRSAIEIEEGVRNIELLQHFDHLGMQGGMLCNDGEVLAVSVGEICGDTLMVHIEKGNTAHTGVYQAISQSFAQYMHQDGVKFINREDDAGDEGLRQSKLSYRPCELLTKYRVRIQK